MAEENPIEQMINELGDLMNLFFDKKDKGLKKDVELNEEVYPALLNAALNVRAMSDALDKAMKEEEMTEAELRKLVREPSDTIDPKDKRVLEKAKNLRREIVAIYRALEKNEEKSPKKKKPDQIFKKGEKKSKKARKNLQIGLRRGWKKL